MTNKSEVLDWRELMLGVGRVLAVAGAVGATVNVASATSPPDPVNIAHRLDAVVLELQALTGRLGRIDAGLQNPPEPVIPAILEALLDIQGECLNINTLVTDMLGKLPAP